MYYTKYFDVIVIGAGHAGTEAAMSSSRIGCQTLLLTDNIETIGQLSCNPAIGGIGKGHLVKEIDAMGGLMGRVIDKTGIHFKKLNSSKGHAVRATRAQADRILYKQSIRYALENQPNLMIFQQSVEKLILDGDKIIGVITSIGIKFRSRATVLTTGTFLNGQIHIGNKNYNGGRAGDASSIILSRNLRKLPFRINRLKTGTPPRIDKRSINFLKLMPQYGDDPIPTFSFVKIKTDHLTQVPCYVTETNIKTHDIIRKNLNLSPIYSGLITGVGPRYCPSIEDKVIRFPTRDSHKIFLEPEGLTSNEVYPNGISTSFPFEVQMEIIHSIQGLESAHIVRPGYAIEYDFLDPRDLMLTLESKFIKGLFLAGQINGTTGYEEAAVQGLLAGLNAARFAFGKNLWIPRRDQAYLGVLVDDLCTTGTKEPYRMFTSRSEYRLCLREDNADLRLTEIARKLGMVNDIQWKIFNIKQENIERERQRLRNIWIFPDNPEIHILNKLFNRPLTQKINGENLLKRPEINYDTLTGLESFKPFLYDKEVNQQVEIQIKYQDYILRQEKDIKYKIFNETIPLPKNFDFNMVSGLSNEVISKLNENKPNSIGQASRIAGVTPASISNLLIWLKKNKKFY